MIAPNTNAILEFDETDFTTPIESFGNQVRLAMGTSVGTRKDPNPGSCSYLRATGTSNPPKKEFAHRPCPPHDVEELDEAITSKGIDAFGQYDPSKSQITLYLCRMRRFATRHGFQFEDVITIVLIHELAHFVTHRGKSDDCDSWAIFEETDSETQKESKTLMEDIAQQATHLYLRGARHGQLVHVFDSLSNYSPDRYRTWRDAWKKQTKPPTLNNYSQALSAFRDSLAKQRKSSVSEREEIQDIIGYDE